MVSYQTISDNLTLSGFLFGSRCGKLYYMFTALSTSKCGGLPAELPVRLALATPLHQKAAGKRRLKPDLDRRRRETLSRAFATRVTEHSRWLPAAELAILNWVYRSDRPLTELADTGLAPRWVLHRKLNRIVARVLSPTYRYVALLLAASTAPPAWPPLPGESEAGVRLATARALFINGLPMREVARTLDISRHVVMKLRTEIEVQAHALHKSGES